MSVTPRPIFIIGSGRSGTSVLTWAIGQHPNIIVTPETNWLTALASYLPGFYNIGVATGAGHLTRFNIDRAGFLKAFGHGADQLIRDSFEQRFPARRTAAIPKIQTGMAYSRSNDDPKCRWVDGTPSNSPYVAILAEMFPEAKFLNLIRNPSDVVRSWLGISWRAKEHSKAAAVVEHIYHSQRVGYLAESALGPTRAARVMYADMVTKPEATMRFISEFVGEAYCLEMTEPITAGKINSSGETKPEVDSEYAAIRKLQTLTEMHRWFELAQDPDWRIEASDHASDELDIYAAHRVALPA